MRINQRQTITALAIILFISCNTNTNENASERNTKEDKCTYNFQPTQTKMKWTAFKTTAKIAVSGTFNTFWIENTKLSNSPSAVFESATFGIATNSVNSGNADRDPRLVNYFFNKMIKSDTISGFVHSISEAINGKGTATIRIKMNGMEQSVNASYTIVQSTITLFATINLNDWKAQTAVDALNNECKDLHTGEDEVSKLWNEVEIVITSSLSKDCLQRH